MAGDHKIESAPGNGQDIHSKKPLTDYSEWLDSHSTTWMKTIQRLNTKLKRPAVFYLAPNHQSEQTFLFHDGPDVWNPKIPNKQQ